MIRFHAPDIATSPYLPESDSKHCIRVLRMHAGDEVEVIDGKGGLYSCRIVAEDHRRTPLEIVSRTELPKVWVPEITVAIAPTKHNDRMEWLVEKLVEIGVDRIVPLLCRRSERKEIKTERLEKIAVSAMKQSLKAVLPRIDEMTPISKFIVEQAKLPSATTQRYICYCDADTPRCILASDYRPPCDATILIGPEGDFDPAEVRAALDAGFVAATLGNNRLRTETAALVACDTIQIINQLYCGTSNPA